MLILSEKCTFVPLFRKEKLSGCSSVRLECLVWDQVVEGSNPFIPTMKQWLIQLLFLFLLSYLILEKFPVGMKGFGKPHFISLRESAPSGSLATLRDRGLTRRLVRSNTLVPALILNFQFSILNYFIKRLGGNKKGVPLQSGKQNGLNQSFPIIELCA